MLQPALHPAPAAASCQPRSTVRLTHRALIALIAAAILFAAALILWLLPANLIPEVPPFAKWATTALPFAILLLYGIAQLRYHELGDPAPASKVQLTLALGLTPRALWLLAAGFLPG